MNGRFNLPNCEIVYGLTYKVLKVSLYASQLKENYLNFSLTHKKTGHKVCHRLSRNKC